jgi:integrase
MAEGFIRRRGDAWQVIVYAGRDPVTGRKRQVSRNVRGTKRDAQAVRAQLLVEVGKGQHEGSDVTFGELVERWYEMAAPDWSPSTATERRRLLDRVILPRMGRVRLQKLRTADLDRLYRELRASGGHQGRPLAPATVRKVHVVVRRALQQAVRWGWLSTNPAVHASPPRVPRHEITPPSPEAIERLLELAEDEDPYLAVLVRLAAATGARRGELCALRWSDLDLDTGTLLIARAMVHGPDGVVERGTKTHAARRIALDRATTGVLAEHRRRCTERALACGVGFGDDARLFSFEPDGSRPWRPDVVTKRFDKLRRKAGIGSVRLHDLRHFVATRLIAAGVPVRTVSGRLGHANAATTLNVYSAFVEASDRDAADVLGDLLPRGGGDGDPVTRAARSPVTDIPAPYTSGDGGGQN